MDARPARVALEHGRRDSTAIQQLQPQIAMRSASISRRGAGAGEPGERCVTILHRPKNFVPGASVINRYFSTAQPANQRERKSGRRASWAPEIAEHEAAAVKKQDRQAGLQSR